MIEIRHTQKFTGRFKELKESDFTFNIIADLGNNTKGVRTALFSCPGCNKELVLSCTVAKRNPPKSCSECYHIRSKKHGDTGSLLYKVWSSMKERCYTKTHQSYSRYGAIGVTVCDEWIKDYGSFKKWAISSGYEEGLALDKDLKCVAQGIFPGFYSPSTCTWLTKSENSKLTGKKVHKTCLTTGEILETYRSQSEAARKNGMATSGGISMCCQGKHTQSNGFGWKLAD